MKQRSGQFLLDALLGLLLLSILAAGLFPFIAEGARALEMAGRRMHMESEGTFAMDFMVEKIRNTRRTTSATFIRRKNEYTFYTRAYDNKWKQVNSEAAYRFYVDGEKLKLELWNGLVQPVTGETSRSKEAYAFERVEKDPVFSQDGAGPLTISFQLHHRQSGDTAVFRTSVMTYADYYKKGQAF